MQVTLTPKPRLFERHSIYQFFYFTFNHKKYKKIYFKVLNISKKTSSISHIPSNADDEIKHQFKQLHN